MSATIQQLVERSCRRAQLLDPEPDQIAAWEGEGGAVRPDTVIGQRHHRADGRECFCGCQHVAGLRGVIIEESRELDLLIAEFSVPCPAGGRARQQLVAYTRSEV